MPDYEFDLHILEMWHKKFTFNDYRKVTSSGSLKFIELSLCEIKNSDGTVVTTDKLLEGLPHLQEFKLACLNPLTFQSDTVQHLKGNKNILIPLSETTILRKICSNKRFSDVHFISSDDTQIQSHRCIVAAYSDVFAKIFDESSEIPVKINAKDFDANTILSAINFLHGKSPAINGKEMEVFKFSVKYGIQALNEACVSYFEESVDSKNVCEYIQIANSTNLANLKEKCLHILVEKKKEIDSTKVAELPKYPF
uniref:BTB domain-containing protein n=1 Tax=Panagrolaimus sp. PS1159 TaxID=55785 RepID=A0AC35EZN7_9BILA